MYFNNKKYLFLYLLILFIWVIAISFSINLDYDLWARLIVGKSIFENGIILKNDFYSCVPTHIWLDHEWGASLIFYIFYKFASLFNISPIIVLNVLKALLVFLIYALITFTVNIENKSFSKCNILLISIIALSANVAYTSTIRCHLLSFLFFTFFIFLLEKYRKSLNVYYLLPLPLFVLLWSNIHGGVLAGLGLIFLYIIGEFFNKKNVKYYVIVLLVSLCALFINPYGAEYVKFLFSAGTMSRNLISEWSSPFSSLFWCLNFKLYFLSIIIVFLFNFKKKNYRINSIDKTKVLIVFLTGLESVLHAKLIPLFVISTAIFMYDEMIFLIDNIFFLRLLFNKKNKVVVLLILLASFLSINIFVKNLKIQQSILSEIYPINAVQYIKDCNIEGNILSNMEYGSFIAYKLFPKNKIFMDGRYEEVYDTKLLSELEKVVKAEQIPDTFLEKYNINLIIVKSNQKISLSNKWKEIYNDKGINKVTNNYWKIYTNKNYVNKNITKTFKKYDIFETQITKELLNSKNK
jgi:hypothetical protein